MKKREKGFMLVETLVVSTMVSTILVILYLQFNTIVRNFNKDFHYNSVNDLYAVQSMKKMILNDNNGNFYTNLKNILANNLRYNGQYFLEIRTDCNASSGNVYRLDSTCATFNRLTNFYQAKRIIFTMEAANLKDTDYNNINNVQLEKFIKDINESQKKLDNSTANNYRIIVEFANNSYATLKMAE